MGKKKNKVVYIHRNLEDNVVFYVGMGKPSRPYNTALRSDEWLAHVESNPYEVVVIATHLTKVSALDVEAGLIKLYGRVSDGTGTLLNKTDGDFRAVERRRGIKRNPKQEAYKKRLLNNKLEQNRDILKRVVEVYNEGKVVTMIELGLVNVGSLWRNIESIVNKLSCFTTLPSRSDALKATYNIFDYLDSVDYIPSTNEIQKKFGGSKSIINTAIKHYYSNGRSAYNSGSKGVIDKVKDKIDNYLDYDYEFTKRGGNSRLILTNTNKNHI